MTSTMRRLTSLICLLTLIVSCGGSGAGSGETTSSAQGGDTERQTPAARSERSGTITVGEQTWTIVFSIQCSVFPGDVVSIAGHAAGDPDLDIVIDYDRERGPVGARIGEEPRTAVTWYSTGDLQVEIDGQRVRGQGTFNTSFTGNGRAAPGSFDVTC